MEKDVVYRQDAIDALGDKPLAWTEGEYELGLQNQWQSDVDVLKELPSAQPDLESAYQEGYTAAESKYRAMMDAQPDPDEWCTDCKEYDNEYHRCPRWNRVIRNTLMDIQPERKKGKWIYGEDEYGIDGYHCDKCGFFVPWDYAHKFISYIEDYNFCPNCGADMRGEQNE